MESVTMDHVHHPQSAASGLVTVGGTNAAQRGTNGPLAPLLFVQAIEDRVIRHHDVGALGDAQRLERYTPRREMVDLLNDQLWIDHHTRADDRETGWVEDPRWNQVERKRSLVGLHGVTGVGATVGPDDDVGGRRQRIGQLPLALVAPLT